MLLRLVHSTCGMASCLPSARTLCKASQAPSILQSRHTFLGAILFCYITPSILVCHSTTKFIDGQGRTVGGAIIGRADLIQKVRFFCRHTGPAMSPFNAWILSKSLETLFSILCQIKVIYLARFMDPITKLVVDCTFKCRFGLLIRHCLFLVLSV